MSPWNAKHPHTSIPVPRRTRPLSTSVSVSVSVLWRIPISSLASSPSIVESDDDGDASESDFDHRWAEDGGWEWMAGEEERRMVGSRLKKKRGRGGFGK
ncbi:hypothetical protein Droror1_Dr00010222 [Drosera rotundifolia]